VPIAEGRVLESSTELCGLNVVVVNEFFNQEALSRSKRRRQTRALRR